jgi:hypothetical protein
MPSTPQYGFHFEVAGRAGYQGPNDPSGEYFTNKDLEQSLTREIIQNSMDAMAPGMAMVTVEFDLRDIPTDEIPGIHGLRASIDAACEASKDLQGRKYLLAARKSAYSSTVPVLRIGDYGTCGLSGSESKNAPLTSLSALTRSTGASSNDGDRGGSFGIGSAVGPLASRLRTVAYVSKRIDDPDVVYAALSRLASHRDETGEWRQGTGYFTSLEDEEDFRYLRNPEPIDGFPERTEDGTDVLIFDYSEAGRDAGLIDVKRAAVENFMVAIHRGRLVVTGRTGNQEWRLDRDSLAEVINADEQLRHSVRPFYRALTETDCVQAKLKNTGDVQLYVYVDEDLEKKLGTQVMRKPLMKVDTLSHSIHTPYAALFICEDDEGNKRLREIEPPTHDKWNDKGPRSDATTVREIKQFIRRELLRVIPEKLGRTATIKGLAKFLPLDLGASAGGTGGIGPTPSAADGTERESPRRLGKPEKYGPLDWRGQGPVSIPVSHQGNESDDGETRTRGGRSASEPGSGGTDGGGNGALGDNGSGDTASGTSGDGTHRILPRNVRFRSYADPAGHSVIVLTALQDVSGDLELTALGAGASDVYDAPLKSAAVDTAGGPVDLTIKGPTIRGITLTKNEQMRLNVKFAHAGTYRLGVKNA